MKGPFQEPSEDLVTHTGWMGEKIKVPSLGNSCSVVSGAQVTLDCEP